MVSDVSAGPKKRTNIYLPLLLVFILANISCDNYIVQVVGKEKQTTEFWLVVGFTLIQIFGSPIQAGFSDFYCRKKSLVVSLSFSLLALALIFLYNNVFASFALLITILLIKGFMGNTVPLSWAAIADTQERNFRFSLGLSTSAFALGYLTLIVVNKFLNNFHTSLILIGFFILLVYCCVFYFYDIRDKSDIKNEHLKHAEAIKYTGLNRDVRMIICEIKMLIEELKHLRTRMALAAFFLWEISLYSVHMLDVDLRIQQFSNLTAAMVVGYLCGVVVLKFCDKVPDGKMIKFGYNAAIISLIPFFALYFFVDDSKFLIMPCYFFYNFWSAFLAPSLFATLSKERKPHEQGKIYGLIDSTDSIAFLLASIVAMVYNFLELQSICIVGFSFIAFVLSWWPYGKFEKTRQLLQE